jgi:ribonucleoside-diphosphate reductase beta chain
MTAPESPPLPPRRGFASARPQGLRRGELPLRLWRKSKRLGVWDPDDIDFSRDREDWARMTNGEQDLVLRLCADLAGGEESVTIDLLPLMMAVAAEGRIEEEMFLTAFIWEEAKHLDFFRRFFDEVAPAAGDLARFHSPSYRRLFHQELPQAMQELLADRSPLAQARASVTYHMIVEGVLAETGYHALFEMLAHRDLMPGLRQGVGLVKRDESRHLAYGVFLISRLVAAEPAIWPAVEQRMYELLDLPLEIVQEIFAAYEPMPFDVQLDDYLAFASRQFSHRFDRIERARAQSLEQVLASSPLDSEGAVAEPFGSTGSSGTSASESG